MHFSQLQTKKAQWQVLEYNLQYNIVWLYLCALKIIGLIIGQEKIQIY
jgi:hypothetical protein